MNLSVSSDVKYEWLPATLEQLNLFYDKSPCVASVCFFMVCSVPLAFVFTLYFIFKLYFQNKEVRKVYLDVSSSSEGL